MKTVDPDPHHLHSLDVPFGTIYCVGIIQTPSVGRPLLLPRRAQA
jgi:hypothetical protein